MKLLDVFLGDSAVIAKRYDELYGKKDHSLRIKRYRSDRLAGLLVILVLSIVIIFMAINGGGSTRGDLELIKKGKVVSAIKKPQRDIKTVDMKVHVRKGRKTLVKNIEVPVEAQNYRKELQAERVSPESKEEKIINEIKQEINEENSDRRSNKLKLPSKLADGTNITWEYQEGSFAGLILIPLLIALVILAKGKYSKLEKIRKESHQDVLMSLPSFINRYILLLNAGAMPEAALKKASESERHRQPKGYFSELVTDACDRSENSMSSLSKELRDVALRIGIWQFIRITTIITDSLYTGSDMSHKLTGEVKMLWFERKKLAESRGKLAEVKLTVPLLLLLLVLMIVTIGPATMDM